MNLDDAARMIPMTPRGFRKLLESHPELCDNLKDVTRDDLERIREFMHRQMQEV